MLGNQKRLLCILLITLFGFASSAHAQDLLVGKQAPAWTLQDSSNQSVDFPSDFAGRPDRGFVLGEAGVRIVLG